MIRIIIFLYIITLCYSLNNEDINPVIGIVGLPTSEGCITMDSPKIMNHYRQLKLSTKYNGTSCFDSFYVKWLEQGGAQVVPLHHNMNDSEIEMWYQQLNGVLFTGGELDLALDSPYVKTTKNFFDLSISNMNDPFPIWGTCQGFQLLNILAAWNTSVLCGDCFVGVDNIPLPIDLTDIGKNSRLIQALPKQVVNDLTTLNITQNFHVSGITPQTFNNNPKLYTFYDAISINHDNNDKVFISTMEAKKWPIYATQWHPERPEFEFVPSDHIAHTIQADTAMQAVANFFVEQTRHSKHKFTALDRLIYNYPTINRGYGTELYVY